MIVFIIPIEEQKEFRSENEQDKRKEKEDEEKYGRKSTIFGPFKNIRTESI